MLDGLKKSIKGAVQGTATKVASKIAQTEWGKEKMIEEMNKLAIPPQAKQMFVKLIENRPDLLQKIAEETESLMKQGKNQMAASQAVMQKYQNEIRQAITGK